MFEDIDKSSEVSRYQDEVDGVIFFGYWNKLLPENLTSLDTLSDLWVNASIDLKSRKWQSEDYNCFAVEVHIKSWPIAKDWDNIIKNSLLWFIDQGAILAWCGGEDSSPSIEIFNPDRSVGNVYAAYSSEIGYICNSSLLDEYQELEDAQLSRIAHSIKQ